MPEDVSLDRLPDELLKRLKESTEEVQRRASKAAEEVAEGVNSDVSSSAPVSKGRGNGGHHLADAFQITPSRYNSPDWSSYYISAKKWHKYSIVHLLELGHLRPFGKLPSVQPHVFMRPAKEKGVEELSRRVSSIIDDSFRKET